MDIQIDINGKQAGLKVSMWLIDANRLQNMIDSDPDAMLWKFTSIIFMAYKNHCRYQKIQPDLTDSEIDLWVDEQFSTDDGKQKLISLVNEITEEINKLSGNNNKDSNGETGAEQKKMIGELSTA